MRNVSILVGAQWGDEGKGKWIDILASEVDIVARYQGGNNAGHTIYVDQKKVVLHQIPSGIFKPAQICALCAGVVINPAELIGEIQSIRSMVAVKEDRLWLSARSHVITPWHIYVDGKKEQESNQPIGTTHRGIGPTYTDKASRTGLRLGEYIDRTRREEWINAMRHHSEFLEHFEGHRDLWEAFGEAAIDLKPFVCDAENRIRKSLKAGNRLLMEGAQGALLDIDHGTYPFVTSSPTSSGGCFASLGFSSKRVNEVMGVAKAYLTRVGEGPFPTELADEDGKHLADSGCEFGATTGRPRRCGWLDAVALRYAAEVGGYDKLIVNKLDVLSGLDRLNICVAYEHPDLGRLEDFPWDTKVLDDCTPIYESFEGWREEITSVCSYVDLPVSAQKYIRAIEELCDCPVAYVGTGVGPKDFLAVPAVKK